MGSPVSPTVNARLRSFLEATGGGRETLARLPDSTRSFSRLVEFGQRLRGILGFRIQFQGGLETGASFVRSFEFGEHPAAEDLRAGVVGLQSDGRFEMTEGVGEFVVPGRDHPQFHLAEEGNELFHAFGKLGGIGQAAAGNLWRIVLETGQADETGDVSGIEGHRFLESFL